MAPNSKELTHDEVWDDSALIESWNEALDEYKKYHSVHAKGGRLEDLDDEELAELQSQTLRKLPSLGGDQTPTAAPPGPENPSQVEDGSQDVLPSDSAANIPTSDQRAPAIVAPPQALLGTVQDEGLKKLLMSWYYAGYYTGLYEGQQQQKTQEGSGP